MFVIREEEFDYFLELFSLVFPNKLNQILCTCNFHGVFSCLAILKNLDHIHLHYCFGIDILVYLQNYQHDVRVLLLWQVIVLNDLYDNLYAICLKIFVLINISFSYNSKNDWDEAKLIDHLLNLVFVLLLIDDGAEEPNCFRLIV